MGTLHVTSETHAAIFRSRSKVKATRLHETKTRNASQMTNGCSHNLQTWLIVTSTKCHNMPLFRTAKRPKTKVKKFICNDVIWKWQELCIVSTIGTVRLLVFGSSVRQRQRLEVDRVQAWSGRWTRRTNEQLNAGDTEFTGRTVTSVRRAAPLSWQRSSEHIRHTSSPIIIHIDDRYTAQIGRSQLL